MIIRNMRYVAGEGLYINDEGPFYTDSGIVVGDEGLVKGRGPLYTKVAVTLLVENLSIEMPHSELPVECLLDKTEKTWVRDNMDLANDD